MTLDDAISNLNLTVDLISATASNRPGTPLNPTRVTVHNTDNPDPGADALAHARYVKGPEARARKVSWHYTADDVRVVQHLPDDEVGWHAKSGNSTSLGVEISQHAGIDQAAVNARAALLVAVLLKRHGLGVDAVVSHKFWTGKQCPRVILESAGGFQSFVDLVSQQFAQIEDVVAFAAAGAVRHAREAGEGLTPRDASRVRILEELLGRAIADAEILRRQLAEVRDEAYEAP